MNPADLEDDDCVSCEYCGQDGLVWVEVEDNKWRLFDGDGNMHNCKRAAAKETK
jgi:hypothetical protein